MDGLKQCSSCQEWKSVSDFHSNGSFGLYSRCKVCKNLAKKVYRATDDGTQLRLQREKRRRYKALVLRHYSDNEIPYCACCGESTAGFLTIDHINGGGNKHRKETGAGWQFYRWLIDNDLPEGYRVLCFNCNSATGAFGVCPHEDPTAGQLQD